MEPDLQPADMTESDETTGSSVSEEEASWISWFCSLRGNDLFCEVDEAYINDEFNLTGLSSEVTYYEYALDTILDAENQSEMFTEEQQELVDSSAEQLYGLIHARYILSAKGLQAMHDKFQRADFGTCNRVYCENAALLPVGQSDVVRAATVALFCARCNEIYTPRSTRHGSLDGAYFGTTFPHLFMMTYPQCVPPPPRAAYVPRVFGFRLHKPDAQGRGEGGRAGKSGAVGDAGSNSSGVLPASSAVAASQGRTGGGLGTPLRARKDITTVLPTDKSGRIIGRDGRLLSPEDDFLDEEDAPGHGHAVPGGGGGGSGRGSETAGGGGGTGGRRPPAESADASSPVSPGGSAGGEGRQGRQASGVEVVTEGVARMAVGRR